jgi:hypothetical protein
MMIVCQDFIVHRGPAFVFPYVQFHDFLALQLIPFVLILPHIYSFDFRDLK